MPAAAPQARRKAALDRYRGKRDFTRTAEPSGPDEQQPLPPNAFVVQKHATRRLHFDFRLAHDGVLKSWAVARGPSLDPADKRLAIEVEDHPMEYGTFEGTIAKGEYGGGTVMLWDLGTWEPLEVVDEGLRRGHLKFTLHGERLKGKWVLVRMGGKAAQSRQPNWLLIKERDEETRPGEDPPLIERATTSVLTGRSMEEIAAAEAPSREWPARVEPDAAGRSHRGKRSVAPSAKPPRQQPRRSSAPPSGAAAPLPDFVPPELPALVKDTPSGAGWVHEIKFDGYRVLLRIAGGQATLLTRTGLDWTARFAPLPQAAAALQVDAALMDGEIVVLNDSGASDFAALQAVLSGVGRQELTLYLFDLLHLNGRDLRGQPLIDRKTALKELIADEGPIRFSEHLDADGAAVFRHVCQLSLEGVVSKRRDAPYRSGRTRDWVKSKCVERQELVIGGFTPRSDGSGNVGALLVGYYRGDELVYAGRVGTGFDARSGPLLRQALEALRRATAPFARPPRPARDVLWVEPERVAEVEFRSWTQDGLLRHAAFKGLRDDKLARQVVLEAVPATPEPNDVTEPKPRASNPVTAKAVGSSLMGVRLTHPDRRLDDTSGLTKRGLAEYYALVASRMLPHVAGRPLSLLRCPGGSSAPCFYQKHPGDGLPKGIVPIAVPEKKEVATYLTIAAPEGLVALAQMGVLEVHPWGARADDVERPDRIVFDFDPDPALPWDEVVAGAIEMRERLEALGLRSFVKTTGGKGLHVVAPILRRHGWPTIKAFSRAVAAAMAKENARYLITMTKAARSGRIFIDYLRNERGATAVGPYSPRARPNAPVATPLEWRELTAGIDPTAFTVATLPRRLEAQKVDPWAELPTVRQSLTTKALRALRIEPASAT